MDYRGGVLSLPQEDMHRAITAATRNNVVIYPIDPRGLSEDGGLAESETGPSTDPDARLGASFARLEARQSLTAIATATGGFALSNSNSFENAFDRIVQENSTYYVLGFSSTNERRDGRNRKLEVRVKRPGLVVRGRAGYMAPLRNERPPEPPKPSSTVSIGVAEALRSTVAVNGLPLRVFAGPFKGAARDATIVIAVEVDASQLGLVDKDGTYVGALEVSYFATDMKNKFYPGQTQTARLTLKPDTYQHVMKTGIRMVVETTLAPGRYQMRVAAGNRESKAGSVVYDLDVPDFTKDPLVLSGVTIGSAATSRIMTMNAKISVRRHTPRQYHLITRIRRGRHARDLHRGVREPEGHDRAHRRSHRGTSCRRRHRRPEGLGGALIEGAAGQTRRLRVLGAATTQRRRTRLVCDSRRSASERRRSADR